MNEELEKYFNTILKLIEQWDDMEESKDRMHTAKNLNLMLTLVRAIMGQRFDDLPSFMRYMNETTKYIENYTKLQEAKEKNA